MVVKFLTGGTGGDLNNSTDNFGADDDLIGMVYGTAADYTIRTYLGDDLIDLRNTPEGNRHWVHTGLGNDTVFGGNGPYDQCTDQSGNDQYTMNGGIDYLIMGFGNDLCYGGAGTDTVSFSYYVRDNGTTVNNTQGVTCDLAKTGVQDFGLFGRDVIQGFETIQGGDGNDRFYGSNGANAIYADLGNDLLVGRGGDDLLTASEGRDTIIGGGGFDNIFLGETTAARDVVRYTSIKDSGLGLTWYLMDRITSFDIGGSVGDRIDLSAIDARADTAANESFVFRGTGQFNSAQGEVRIVAVADGCFVMIDNDADKAAEMTIFVHTVAGLSASDFIL